MRLRTAPLAAALLAAGLGLTACSNSSDTGAGTGTGASANSSAPAPAQPGSDNGTNDNPDSPGSDKSRSKTKPKGKNKGIAASTHCTTAGLAFAVAPGSGAQEVNSQGDITLTLTNKGTAPCSLNGYPGVDLVAAPTGTSDGTWSLGRETAKKPQHVTLKPGAESSFTITYLPYSAEGNSKDAEFKVSKIVITPPGETHSTSLPWTFQPVLLQDGATHPGTYVGPVEPSSSAGEKPTTARPPAHHKPSPAKRKTRSTHR
ncbi:DUF4232 domain-containing protein [Streptomyces sp. NPDC054863]